VYRTPATLLVQNGDPRRWSLELFELEPLLLLGQGFKRKQVHGGLSKWIASLLRSIIAFILVRHSGKKISSLIKTEPKLSLFWEGLVPGLID
jgi:hypothetical protein